MPSHQDLERLLCKKPPIQSQSKHSCLMMRFGPKLRLTDQSFCSWLQKSPRGIRNFAISLTVVTKYVTELRGGKHYYFWLMVSEPTVRQSIMTVGHVEEEAVCLLVDRKSSGADTGGGQAKYPQSKSP